MAWLVFFGAWQAGGAEKRAPLNYRGHSATSHFRCVYDFNFDLWLKHSVDTRSVMVPFPHATILGGRQGNFAETFGLILFAGENIVRHSRRICGRVRPYAISHTTHYSNDVPLSSRNHLPMFRVAWLQLSAAKSAPRC